jgi:hypothetical protein
MTRLVIAVQTVSGCRVRLLLRCMRRLRMVMRRVRCLACVLLMSCRQPAGVVIMFRGGCSWLLLLSTGLLRVLIMLIGLTVAS